MGCWMLGLRENGGGGGGWDGRCNVYEGEIGWGGRE